MEERKMNEQILMEKEIIDCINTIFTVELTKDRFGSYIVSADNIKNKKWYDELRIFIRCYKSLTCAIKKYRNLQTYEIKLVKR